MTNPKRVTLHGRLAFPTIRTPEKFQGTGDPRYSATVLFEPDSDSDKKAKQAMLAAAVEKWGEDEAKKMVKSLFKANKTAYYDGDMKATYDGFEGMMVVAGHAREHEPPALVATQNGKNVRLDRETQNIIYGGCYVNAIYEFWAQDNKWGKRINATICGLQFAGDGPAFSSSGPAVGEDDFDLAEVEVDTGDLEPDFDDDEFDI